MTPENEAASIVIPRRIGLFSLGGLGTAAVAFTVWLSSMHGQVQANTKRAASNAVKLEANAESNRRMELILCRICIATVGDGGCQEVCTR